MEEFTCDWIRLATLNQVENELFQHPILCHTILRNTEFTCPKEMHELFEFSFIHSRNQENEQDLYTLNRKQIRNWQAL